MRQFPERHLTLDLDESFDRVHGEQELRKFNAYYDDWGFLPIHIFDTSGRLVVSVLREAATPSGREILALVKRVVGHLRERFPRVRIRLRGDSHYACPEVMSWCEANGLEYIFGLSGNATLAARVQALEARTAARYAARRAAEPPKFKLRRYMDFQGGAKSWNCTRRIVARVEAGPDGVDTRYIVTNLTDRRAQRLYERKYCQRGRMENLLKSFTWPPPPARELAPIKSGSFYMGPPIGCSGLSRASCRSARPGAWSSSTPSGTG